MLGGGGSIKLARVFGIRVGVEPGWFVIAFILIWVLSGQYSSQFPGEETKAFVLAVLSALFFFTSIVLHELGHAVVAIRNGIRIEGIDLWMFGGVAKLSRDSKTAGEEFRVAAAGPAVTLVIAVAGYAALTIIGVDDNRLLSLDPAGNEAVTAVLGYVTYINFALLVFNLIPGYPLDGGRIARAIAWQVTGDRNRALRFAAKSGQAVAYLMMGVGVVVLITGVGDLITGIWLILIGVFLGQAARSEGYRADFSDRLDGIRVADVMDAEPVAIPEDLPLDRAYDEFFLRYRYPWFPVVDSTERFTGLVTADVIEGLPDGLRAGRTVGSVMAREEGGDTSLTVAADDSLESLLGREGLTRLGALIAVDGAGRLTGVVTADGVRRAVAAA